MPSNLRVGNAREQTELIWLIAVCMMIQPLATDLYLPSLPHIAAYFQSSSAMVQKTLSFFLLGFAGLQLVSGPLSDRFGRRPILILGLAVYVLASIACTVSSTLDSLIVGRIFQAIGCCSVVVVARSIVHDVYPGAEGTYALAKISGFYALAPLLGPLAGAYLQVMFGWQAAFVVFSVTGTLLAAIVFLRLPETNGKKKVRLFVLSQFFLDYIKIIKSPIFWAYALPGALSFGSLFIYLSGGAFLIINVFLVPTKYSGIFFACGALGYMSGTVVCRRLLRRHGLDRTLRFGGNLAFGACLIYPLFAAAGMAHWSTFLIGQCSVMFAHGINFPCAQSGAVTPFPGNTGVAAALMGSFAMVLAFALGTLVGSTYDGTPLPIGFILAATGAALFASNRLLESFRRTA